MIQLQQFFTKVPLAAVGQIRRKREGGQVGRPVGQGDPAGTGPPQLPRGVTPSVAHHCGQASERHLVEVRWGSQGQEAPVMTQGLQVSPSQGQG